MIHLCKGLHYQTMQSVIIKSNQNNRIHAKNGYHRHTLKVSTTKGTPSKSVDLKEALCEKIPLHYDLLRNFRSQHGRSVITSITVDDMYQGLKGVNTLVRETSEVDLKYGIKYRGMTISEVIALLPRQGNSPSAEAVFWLLLTGDVPTQEQVSWLISDWTSRRQKRKEWWSGPNGGIVGSVLRTLPKSLTPLEKWCVSLMILDANRHLREALMKNAMSHTYWEYAYEDSMELLATLPAFVGLINDVNGAINVTGDGDWAQFLVDCLGNTFQALNARKKSAAEFLRLYIVLNADEDGGVPGAHVTEIVGSSRFDINQALAAGALAYASEPKTGTLQQCMEFQTKLRNSFGSEPETGHFKNCIAALMEGSTLIGHKEAAYCDPRYTALLNYVREHVPEDPNIQMSQNITRILTSTMKNTKGSNIFPDQNAIAAPLFQFYGLKDMTFNQIIFCMSRALGDLASIIWSRVINSPVEHPRSKCTHTCMELLQTVRKETARGKYTKLISK